MRFIVIDNATTLIQSGYERLDDGPEKYVVSLDDGADGGESADMECLVFDSEYEAQIFLVAILAQIVNQSRRDEQRL